VLSLNAPGIEGWSGKGRIHMAHRVNDYGAALVQKYPDRFADFAARPLPDVNQSLAEMSWVFDVLGVDGVVLHSYFDGSLKKHVDR
jgi:6-methylsalicylate decarboxylase